MNVRACIPLLERSFRDQQDRLRRAYRCARHWLSRNDREVGQPLECLACCVSLDGAAFSSLARDDSSIGILTRLMRLSVSISPLLFPFLLAPVLPRRLFYLPTAPVTFKATESVSECTSNT